MIDNPVFLNSLGVRKILPQSDIDALHQKYNGDTFAVMLHLVKHGVVSKEEMGKLWGDSLGVSFLDLKRTLFQPEVVQWLPFSLARQFQAIPVYELGGKVTIATSDPLSEAMKEKVEEYLQHFVSPAFAFPEDIEGAIMIQYQTTESLNQMVEEAATKNYDNLSEEASLHEITRIANDNLVIDFAKNLIYFAIKERASDIHIEPREKYLAVRLRVDGILQEKLQLNSSFHLPFSSHLKILAGSDIVERRRPQDGHISFRLSDRSVDIRFSSVPTIYGEKIVLRILDLDRTGLVPDITELGLSRATLQAMQKVIQTPNGSFFVTGPTGSGKTTTLYAILKYLNKPGVNIMTIEDPVEYRLPGLNQIQVNMAAQVDFARALRSFLRQDPDVILIGEIRDVETAKIASQAALTGHLVFATMHTNTALQAVIRLIEIGVAPFLVAPSIIGVMGQRLVRRICGHCRESYAAPPAKIDELFLWDGKTQVSFFRGKGCFHCNFTGYHGRCAIHEIFILTDEMRRLISQNAPMSEIKTSADASGFRTMRYDGIKKVLRGITTLEEVNRVTLVEEA